MSTRSYDISRDILFEDNHLMVVNKRPSAIVQGDKTGDETLLDILKGYIKKKYNKPGLVFLGLVHRLDRPVSGAVIFAKTSKALSRLNEMLKNGRIRKTYWAVVKEKPPSDHGELVHYLVRNETQNKSRAFDKPVPNSKKAELDYTMIAQCERYWLLEVHLKTGRHHQIRAQLAAIGCPIRGDLKYGYPRTNRDASIHLHARSVGFLHPVKQENLLVVAPPPDEPVWNLFRDIDVMGEKKAGS